MVGGGEEVVHFLRLFFDGGLFAAAQFGFVLEDGVGLLDVERGVVDVPQRVSRPSAKCGDDGRPLRPRPLTPSISKNNAIEIVSKISISNDCDYCCRWHRCVYFSPGPTRLKGACYKCGQAHRLQNYRDNIAKIILRKRKSSGYFTNFLNFKAIIFNCYPRNSP